MNYLVGPTGLGADALEKMQVARLEVVSSHVPWYPDGFEASLGLDRCYNHPHVSDHEEVIVLPVFLVVSHAVNVGLTTYHAAARGNYWASAIIQNKNLLPPPDTRLMMAGEGSCALAQYPNLRSFIVGAGWYEGGYCEVSRENDGSVSMCTARLTNPKPIRVAYIPLSIQGNMGKMWKTGF